MFCQIRLINFLILILFFSISGTVSAMDTFTISIKDHKFQPDTLTVPSGKKVKLVINNEDSTPEEFESYELNREKIIPGGRKAVVYIGPLKPGSYPFVGEFNPKTAKGRIIAK